MTDDISATKHYRQAIATVCEGFTLPDAARKVLETALWNPPTESATTPAEVDAPEDGAYLIQYDDPSQSPELFVGHGAHDAAHHRYAQISDSWNAHLFAKIASNSRDCTVPNYATTLARQLAKSERDCAELRALLTAQNAAVARTDALARQLAEAKAGMERRGDDMIVPMKLLDEINTTSAAWQERAEQAESALAEATRRLEEVEAALQGLLDYAELGDITGKRRSFAEIKTAARAALKGST